LYEESEFDRERSWQLRTMTLDEGAQILVGVMDVSEPVVQMSRNIQTRIVNCIASIPVHSGMLMHRVDLRDTRIPNIICHQKVPYRYSSPKRVSADQKIEAASIGDALSLDASINHEKLLARQILQDDPARFFERGRTFAQRLQERCVRGDQIPHEFVVAIV
jgi:hypothetical protein